MNLKEDTEVLLRLGLTVSQGKVYVALLKLGAGAKVAAIAKFADIPRQDVYRVLEELQNLGIVHKTFENPARFWGAPPKEVVHSLLSRKMKDFSKLEDDADKFAESIMETLNETSILPEKNQFVLFTDREDVTCRVSKAIENTQTTINAFAPLCELARWLTVLSESYDEALDRGVKVRYITEKPANISALPKTLSAYMKHKNFEVRFITDPSIAKIVTYDGKEVILALSKDGPFACPGLWSNNPSLVAIAENHFENSWKKALNP